MSHHLGTMTCEQGSVLTSTFLDLDVDDNDAGNATDLAVLIRVPAIRPMRPARSAVGACHGADSGESDDGGASTATPAPQECADGGESFADVRHVGERGDSASFGDRAGSRSVGGSGGESSPPRLASAAAPAVWLRIETAREVPLSRPEPAVVLPGYVLPDDGMEDSHHAGR